MTVGELQNILSNYEDDMPVLLVEHPYRGSSSVLTFGVYDVMEGLARTWPEQGTYQPKDTLVFEANVTGSSGDFSTIIEDEDGEQEFTDNDWPGRE